MGRAFESAHDFNGAYSGSYDGRVALLNISAVDSGGDVGIEVTFIDKSERQNFEAPTVTVAANSHVINNLQPWMPEGSGVLTLNWPLLLLHTWDIDHISGVSTWNNTPYGMSFTRTSGP